YVGATNSFIKTPFFIEGMVTGFFAGAGAFFITWVIYNSVYNILMEQGTLINAFGISSIIPFDYIRIITVVAYIITGSFLGAIGSTLSTQHHLDV
ncbi:MAG: ABC transporter permease, partial [Ruminococcus sp.]|nr:ABC transporter permease [Ruminococcus sp.]